MTDPPAPSPGHHAPADQGVYGITVAAGLVGTGVQNLRLYEARGLITPDRTEGGTRRYSDDDIERLRRISALLDDGLNLAGISRVLALEDANADLHQQNSVLRLGSGMAAPEHRDRDD